MPEPKLGLVLGSGGARGWAHIGVLQVLREKGIRPDLVVGTSIGSIVGAVLAEDRLDEVSDFAEKLDWSRAMKLFFEVGVHPDGLLRGTRVMEFLGRLLPVETIEELPMPYAAVATDIHTGKTVVMTRGRVTDAIRASISIPGVFTPVRRGHRVLVDGGLSSPVPVDVARKMGAERVIAVNIDVAAPCPYHAPPKGRIGKAIGFSDRVWTHLRETSPAVAKVFEGKDSGLGIFDVLLKTTRIAEDRIAAEEVRRTAPDVLIEPAVGDILTMDFSRATDAIQAGRDAAEAALG